MLKKTLVTLKDITNNTYAQIFTYGALLNKFCNVNNEETIYFTLGDTINTY